MISIEPISREQAVDPFAFFPDATSKIGGVGGASRPPEPTYAFHTPYVLVARGARRFTIRFDGLLASRGSLLVRVHMTPPGGQAKIANSQRFQLADLATTGECEILFEGYSGCVYAIYAIVPDDTDATAKHISVVLDCAVGPEDDTVGNAPLSPAADLVSDSGPIVGHVRLSSLGKPTLADPVSQPFTLDQTRELSFLDWRRKTNASVPDSDLWKQLFVIQSLRRYGLLQPGAQGFGTLAGYDLLLGALETAGVLVSGPPDAGRGEDAIPARRSGGFDFSWDWIEPTDTDWKISLTRIEEGLKRIRMGGIAIVLFPFYAFGEANVEPIDGAMTVADVERLMLSLLARSEQVAQIKFAREATEIAAKAQGSPNVASTIPFGMIVRRASMTG
jgi:hypothetical protein